MSFHEQINKLSKSSFYFLYNIRKVRKYLTKDITATLVHAFVTCRLDYCNSILYGLPAYQIAKIQRAQNAAARLVCKVPRFAHITPYLKELHWQPVKFRVKFKILALTFQAICGLASLYLCELIRIKDDSCHHLRSSDELLLAVPSSKSLPTLGDRALQFAAPSLWNSLPKEIRQVQSLFSFKKQLKTFLFRAAYTDLSS